MFDSQGRRLAEYDEATGGLIREYVWMDWEPVAVIESGVVYYVRADHIEGFYPYEGTEESLRGFGETF